MSILVVDNIIIESHYRPILKIDATCGLAGATIVRYQLLFLVCNFKHVLSFLADSQPKKREAQAEAKQVLKRSIFLFLSMRFQC